MKRAGSSGFATAEPKVQAEGIIAAIVGALSGGGGVRLLWPERDAAIAKYYRGVIRDLRKDNEQLQKRVSKLGRQVEQLRRLEDRITELELAQDNPPPHLG